MLSSMNDMLGRNVLGAGLGAMSLKDDGLHYHRQVFGVSMISHAEAGPDLRSGMFGRKHTVSLTVTLADGSSLLWQRTAKGQYASTLQRQAQRLAVAINNAVAAATA